MGRREEYRMMKNRRKRNLAVLTAVYALTLGAAACTAEETGSAETSAVKETVSAAETNTNTNT